MFAGIGSKLRDNWLNVLLGYFIKHHALLLKHFTLHKDELVSIWLPCNKEDIFSRMLIVI